MDRYSQYGKLRRLETQYGKERKADNEQGDGGEIEAAKDE